MELAVTFNFSLQCAKRFTRIGDQRDFRRPILADVCRIDIDMNYPRLRCEGGKFSGDAIVESHADGDQKIALSDGHIRGIRAAHAQHVQAKWMHRWKTA